MTRIEPNHQLLTQFVDNTAKQAEKRVEISFSADSGPKFLAHFDACKRFLTDLHTHKLTATLPVYPSKKDTSCGNLR